MNQTHIYFGIENLAMNSAQKATLHDLLKSLGIAPDSYLPAYREHWKWRLDGEAVIYEGLLDDTDLSVSAFKQHMAVAFGVDVGDIDSTQLDNQYGRVYTFTYIPNATDYFRMAAFGWASGWPSWFDSHAAMISYVLDNFEAWNTIDV